MDYEDGEPSDAQLQREPSTKARLGRVPPPVAVLCAIHLSSCAYGERVACQCEFATFDNDSARYPLYFHSAVHNAALVFAL